MKILVISNETYFPLNKRKGELTAKEFVDLFSKEFEESGLDIEFETAPYYTEDYHGPRNDWKVMEEWKQEQYNILRAKFGDINLFMAPEDPAFNFILKEILYWKLNEPIIRGQKKTEK